MTDFNRRRKKDTGEVTDNGGQWAEGRRHEPQMSTVTNEQVKEFCDFARRIAARRYTQLGRFDLLHRAEDTAQDALEKFIDVVHRNPHLLEENTKGYITTIVNRRITDEVSPVAKSVRGGLSVLIPQIQEREQELGRELTYGEVAALGQQVRDSWSTGSRKPPANFWDTSKYARQEIASDMSEFEPADLKPAFGSSDEGGQNIKGFWSHVLSGQIESGKSASIRVFRYNAFAEQKGIPVVHPGSVTRREEMEARQGMSVFVAKLHDMETVVDSTPEQRNKAYTQILESVAKGHSHPYADTFFVPWTRRPNQFETRNPGAPTPLDKGSRREIAAKLLEHPELVDSMWRSALAMADRMNYSRVISMVDYEETLGKR